LCGGAMVACGLVGGVVGYGGGDELDGINLDIVIVNRKDSDTEGLQLQICLNLLKNFNSLSKNWKLLPNLLFQYFLLHLTSIGSIDELDYFAIK
jgi:hypothetical protein